MNVLILLPVLLSAFGAPPDFVNWESPHIHPLDLTPNGELLLAVNTPDARLEVFSLESGAPVLANSIAVGLDPVSVRARSDEEAWIVNRVSDTISIVDLTTGNVTATLPARDEPADVIFAGSPQRAFVSSSQADVIEVWDPAALGAPLATIPLDAQSPRMLARSLDGSKVYAAIFESGNGSTVLGGGFETEDAFPPNVVDEPGGPHGGVNPPPNAGEAFDPPIRNEYLPGGVSPAPQVSLIVQKNVAGRWMDDNGGDWTAYVDGVDAALSGRVPGWDLPDRDLAVIDASTFDVDWAHRMLTHVMALGVRPDGRVTAVGTEALNVERFEPVLKARFVQVRAAFVDPATNNVLSNVDLNDHLDYSAAQIAAQSDGATADQGLRDRSIGDPRAIVWNATGERGYIAGMGSNNVAVVDAAGARLDTHGGARAIGVGEGPTGLAFDAARSRLYVLNRFSSELSIVDLATETELSRIALHDPSPPEIRAGRRHLYDTHATSGLGQVSCASCHVDARMDRLAWDLGDPSGEVKALNQSPGQHNLGMNAPVLNTGFEPFHPMKGPMTTQTLQDIIGKEPHHWRGDRDGIEEFNPAFRGLLGDDQALTPTQMQEFEDFLATIHFPPNPFRNLDNTLPADLPLPGHFASGRFAGDGGLAAGDPLPDGDATRGLDLFRPPNLLDSLALACVTCHTMPTGAGGDVTLVGLDFQTLPPGPDGERHLALVSVDGATNTTMKTPHLRNLYDKVGFETTQSTASAGFGFFHDGSVDSIARFISEPVFNVTSDQDVADLVALMLSFSGSDLPQGSTSVFDLEPPGPPSLDTHAAVGVQLTIDASNRNDAATIAHLSELVALAASDAVGLIAKGRTGGELRGWEYVANAMRPDRASEAAIAVDALRSLADDGSEITFTVVPIGTQTRLGVDRDRDGFFDRDELDACSDPADGADVPGSLGCVFFSDGFESGDLSAWSTSERAGF